MTNAQKIIKYLAIAFAIFLIVTIISTITATLFALSGVLGLKNDIEEKMNSEMVSTDFKNANISTLDIDIAFTNLTIKTGDTLKLETDNSSIVCNQYDKKLLIDEKNNRLFSSYIEKELILYLPKELQLETVDIATGAGKVDIESLNTEKLSFELGAGETEIQSLNVSRKCEIDGGAGKLTILDSTINDIDLDMGVGKVNLTANLIGKNEINAGVGSLNIDLLGKQDSYKIRADKGIGSIKIDGKEIESGETFGDGDNQIEIDGGVGNINIEFK